MPPTAPINIIAELNRLLEAELNSIFRLIDEDFPYLNRSVAALRQPISRFARRSREHIHALAHLIDELGGTALARHTLQREEQYMSYLSLGFLLPKLVDERRLMLERYRSARHFMGSNFPEVVEVLDRIITEQRHYFEKLQMAIR